MYVKTFTVVLNVRVESPSIERLYDLESGVKYEVNKRFNNEDLMEELEDVGEDELVDIRVGMS